MKEREEFYLSIRLGSGNLAIITKNAKSMNVTDIFKLDKRIRYAQIVS